MFYFFSVMLIINSIDNAVISVGGGGLIAGVGSMIKQKFPKCKIIGVEPKRSKDEDDKNAEESSALGSLGLKPKTAH